MTDSALTELWGCQGWFNWAELNLSQETNRDREGKGKNLWSWSIKPIRPFDLDHTAYFAEMAAITLFCSDASPRYVGGPRKWRLPATSQTNSQRDLSFLFSSVAISFFVFHPVMSCCLKQQLEHKTRTKVMLRSTWCHVEPLDQLYFNKAALISVCLYDNCL